MRKALSLLVAVLCLALAGAAFAAESAPAAGAAAAPEKPVGKEVGMYLKAFSLKAPLEGGKTYTAESFYGKPTLYSFIQSACSICRNEVFELNSLYPDVRAKMNIVAVFLDVDDTRIAKYREKNSIEFLMLHDPGADVAESVGFSASPAVVIVSADGKIVKKLTGYREKMIAEALKELK